MNRRVFVMLRLWPFRGTFIYLRDRIAAFAVNDFGITLCTVLCLPTDTIYHYELSTRRSTFKGNEFTISGNRDVRCMGLHQAAYL